MASRKRKTKKQRQRRQQRQAARARKKRKPSRRSRQSRALHPRDEVMADMLPLFSGFGGPSAPSGSDLHELMTTLIASEDLAGEPELEGLLINPMLCAEMVAQVGEEIGYTPEALTGLSEQEQTDAQMEIMAESLRRLLTEEWCQDVLKGLDNLRLRLKRSGDKQETARIAVLQSFMREDKTRSTWPMIGLVQAIFFSSVAAGFEMLEASAELLEADGTERRDAAWVDRMMQSSRAQKASRTLEKIPGLKTYMERQTDQAWEEGIDAVFEGNLYLALYSREELEGAAEVLATLIGYESAEEMLEQEDPLRGEPQDVAKTYVARLQSYLSALFTPARLEQLQSRMDAVVADPAYKGQWFPFVVMLREYLQDENAIQNEMGTLIGALFGEMRVFEEMAREEGAGA